ncbi:MAG TPA: ANTAR domain-containing protein [Jatrophihabitans sp.]|nr:ANTAR domain-containing protein [Jatrophihabitans sp.]
MTSLSEPIKPRDACDTAAVDLLLELARHVVTEPECDEHALAAALRTAAAAVPGGAWAAVLLGGERPKHCAASHPHAAQLDELQCQLGSGPSLAALSTDAVVLSDLRCEDRWPDFVRATPAVPVQAVLSYPLAAAGHPDTALTFYLGDLEPVGTQGLSRCNLAAAGFALACRAIKERDNARQLRLALESNRQIGAAIGILMHTYRITDSEAFDLLRVTSQHGHRKLREIADDVVFTGVLPPQ